MTADALAVVQFLFGTIWQFFNSWYIPGTRMTPAGFFLGVLFAGLIINFFLRMLNFNASVSLNSDKSIPHFNLRNGDKK